MFAFVGRKSAAAQPSPTPLDLQPEPILPSASPVPTATIAPVFAPLAVFNTEQVYVCNRDGFDLRPLTTRDGLIYFGLAWAPDSHALAALACKENEWEAREKGFKTPAGRPRLIMIEGAERLLDDQLAEAPIVWSPDSSKVATAFESDIGVYDAANKSPTQARIKLNETLLTASASYEEKLPGKKVESAKPDGIIKLLELRLDIGHEDSSAPIVALSIHFHDKNSTYFTVPTTPILPIHAAFRRRMPFLWKPFGFVR